MSRPATALGWSAGVLLAAFFVYAIWVLSEDAPPLFWVVLALLVALFVIVLVIQP